MLCHLQDHFRTKYDNRIYLITNTLQTLNSPLYFHYLLVSYKEMTCHSQRAIGSDAHTFTVQARGIQSECNTCYLFH